MQATAGRGAPVDPALAWSQRLEVEVGGAGTVAAAGVVGPRLLADRLGLTTGLAQVMARAGFFPLRHRGRALVDATCALAAGASCLADVEAMTAQEEIFGLGGGASDSTMLRVLDELGERLGADGLPGRRLARVTAAARARAWEAVVARHGQLPAVRVAGTDLTRPATEPGGSPRPVLVLRLDATVIEAASPKAQAAGTYKGGFGFHPLTGWCTNVGDAVAVTGRPGNAGSFTAADHIAVLKAAFTQIPAQWRTDVLVSIDGAGASHEIIDYLTALNTAPEHGRRGRRVEYTIGWPVDERTLSGIAQLREGDWGAAVDADGEPDPAAQVLDLTGVLRRGPDGDRLATWPADMRVMARRTPRPLGKPARLGEHPEWEYGAFSHLHRAWPDRVPRRPPPHPGPRRGPAQAVQGLRRPHLALDRLRPQRRLAATGRPGHLADRLVAPHRTRRRPGQGLHQDAAVPDLVRPGAAGHPRPTTDPEDPARLGMGRRSGHRLGPAAGPAPHLIREPNTCPDHPRSTRPAVEPAPTRAPSGAPACPTPESAHQ